MMKVGFLKRILMGVLMLALATSPTATSFALSEYWLDMFAQNDIMFYDPEGTTNFCSTGDGDCYISGSTWEEKMWSGLRHVGFTPEQAAGIMGNIVHEGSTPTRQEQAYIIARKQNCRTQEGLEYTIYLDGTNNAHHGACMEAIYSGYAAGEEVAGIGLGFVQWTAHNRRMGYLKKMEESGLLKYFEGDAYLTYGGPISDSELKKMIEEETGSDKDYWALWCAAIKFIYTEMMTEARFKEFFKKTSVSEYAGFIASVYEVCASCSVGASGYNSRIEAAEKYYEMYENGSFSAVENVTASSTTTSPIQRTGDCMIPYNVTEVEDALIIARQFIRDTNALYGTDYKEPETVVDDNPKDKNGVTYKLDPSTPNGDSPPESARGFIMKEWKDGGIIEDGVPTGGCWGATYCGQCTAFSGWFVSMLTGYTYGLGNGREVVSNLQKVNPGLQVSDTPVPFSVFSEGGGDHGHTGVVVGDFGDGTYFTIENNNGNNKILKIHRRSFGSSARFAILSDRLKLENIGR